MTLASLIYYFGTSSRRATISTDPERPLASQGSDLRAGRALGLQDIKRGVALLAVFFAASACRKEAPAPTAPRDARRVVGDASTPKPRPLRFGFAPSHGAIDAAKAGQRLAAFLSERAGVHVTPFVASSYGTLVKGIREGWVDIGWLPPFVYVMAARDGHAVALARFVRTGKGSYHSAFIVRAQSPLRSFGDLRGKRMAYTDPRSSGGYLVPRAHLVRLGFEPDQLFSNQAFVGSHKAVVEAVLNGQADVGVTFFSPIQVRDGGVEIGASAWHQHYPARAKEIRVLAQSDAIPSDVISARTGCPIDAAERVRRAFYDMHTVPAGRELLQSIFNAERATVAYQADYKHIEQIMRTAQERLPAHKKGVEDKTR
jgi:phosphonate transport system substrate-binding protein